MKTLRRLLIDSFAFSLLVAQYGLSQAIGGRLNSITAFLILSPPVVWIVSATVVASMRAFAEMRLLQTRRSLMRSAVEWIALFSAANIFTCWLDTVIHPRETFLTVFGFNVLVVFVPALIVSTIGYCVTSSAVSQRRS